MEGEHEQPCAGQQSAEGHSHVASSALQPRAEDTSNALALAENPQYIPLYFHEDQYLFHKAQQWSLDPSTFFRGALPQGCVGCQIYRRIRALSSESSESSKKRKSSSPNERELLAVEARIRTAELRIYMVFFHLLRDKFHEICYAERNNDPLAIYLSRHGFEEAALLKEFTNLSRRGRRYHRLTTHTQYRGLLLLRMTFAPKMLDANKEAFEQVLAAAIDDIQYIGISASQTYIQATDGIFGIFERGLQEWIDSMAQKSYMRIPVQRVIDLRARSSSDQNPPCPTPFDVQLATVPETSAVPGTFPAFPQTAIVAVCVDGTVQSFDPSTILLIQDVSGVTRPVQVGALAKGSNIPVCVAPQMNYPSSSEAANEVVFSSTEWP
ncbi:hypothetical protein BHE90_016419 [Fusarium euwallaceae]|uniref:Uncharacterized protein n=2 Tax=Fusarium solani species complex TaxID=232080 RepID=A0A428RN43_9HYPO|nr:hypothetical protein CEP52_017585 [Fusarium oligoseptatum]RTE69201.1 hypothetical protein BHE90_016419 [Fusarium euwallaceae]